MSDYKFYRDDIGKWVEAKPERWRWVAQYTDGSELKQFGDDGIYHQFREIDQQRLHTFSMVSDERPPLVLAWVPGRKLIHFYNNYVKKDSNGTTLTRIYCFGYEEKGHKVIFCIMPDDGIVITDDQEKVKVI